jgi:hypothetical protein
VVSNEGSSPEIRSNVSLAMLFICSFDRSFPSKVIPSYFTFLDKRIQWPHNLNSGTHLYEQHMKNIAETWDLPVPDFRIPVLPHSKRNPSPLKRTDQCG